VAVDDGPTIVRFPTGSVPADIPALRRVGGVDVLAEEGGTAPAGAGTPDGAGSPNGNGAGHPNSAGLVVDGPTVNGATGNGPTGNGATGNGATGNGARRDVLLVAVGAFAGLGLGVATRLAAQGFGVTVVDPRWVRPTPPALVDMARGYRLVVSVEDGVRTGGVGDALGQAMRDGGVDTPLRDFGVERDWHPHGSRPQILAGLGLTAADVAREVVAELSRAGEAVARPRPADPARGAALTGG
jgi:1-deoxy-D-xylulose-5-phosphate synthase